MQINIKVPSVGESVQEAVLAQWFKQDGDRVQKDDPLFVLETDKVTLEVTAQAEGVLHIKVPEGETVLIGAVVGAIDTEADAGASEADPQTPVPKPPKAEERSTTINDKDQGDDQPEPAQSPGPTALEPVAAEAPLLSPAVRRLVAEKNVDIAGIVGSGPGGRITKGDVLLHLEQAASPAQAPQDQTVAATTDPEAEARGKTHRKAMSPIRRRIAEHLLEARQNTAMLTTFNEIDMSTTMAMRANYKEAFSEKHGVALGFMSFFIRATVEALKAYPEINAFIDGTDILYHEAYHIGVAIGSERGLVVPVIRNAQAMSFADLERAIVDFVKKIKSNRLSLEDLEGGTFTISNGGVYGSLLSTPILNTPQSGILGMHKIEKRPVVADDQVVIRPMMYVALSYDHRIVDGREAVGCLKRIKELVENPERIMMEI